MIEISGLAGTLLLLLPFAVLLLTVVACLHRTSKTTLNTMPRISHEPISHEPVAHEAVAYEPPALHKPVLHAAAAAPRPVLTAIGGGTDLDVRTDAGVLTPPAGGWLEQIRLAEERKDLAALPALYLALGQEEIARGHAEEGAGHLRSCIRAAVRARNASAEAEARLELAELARESGDLTTACEHWQIARSLFHKLAHASHLADTEDLMRRHGCPTDWVLTDF